jgi:transposase
MVDPLLRSIHHRRRLAQELSYCLGWLKHVADQLHSPVPGAGVRGETTVGYKVSGGAEMTDYPLVRACASPLISVVRDSSATLASAAMCIPFKRSSRIRRFPWHRRSSIILEQTMAMRKRDEEEVFPHAAGIDVGASSHWVAVPKHLAEESVREFGAMTDDLNALADWLLACSVDTVALESTGVYWIPIYEVLEQRGLKVWLVDARQMKYVPGRKSDVQDCQWLQRLMSLGLLRAAWRPSEEVCVVRAVVRRRDVLLTEQGTWVQRMQKALVQMNIQLTEVLSDVMGMTGQAIIRDIVAGERDPLVLARHHNHRIKASKDEVTKALTGNWRDEHLFLLKQSLAIFDDLAKRVQECDAKIEALLAPLQRHTVQLKASLKGKGKNNPAFDVRQAMANWAGVDLTRIDGLGVSVVMKLLSEIGTDLSRFANVKHFCSWLGLCPGTKVSGGKVLSAGTKRSANRARQALKMAAMSLSRSDSALGAFYRRLCSRMDKPRANTAVAHKLSRMVYYMLTRGEEYVDQGRERYEEQQRQRSISALKRRAAALGFQVAPIAAAA